MVEDQLAMVNTLVSHGANREDFKALTPERFVQFCEAWLQMDDRMISSMCYLRQYLHLRADGQASALLFS